MSDQMNEGATTPVGPDGVFTLALLKSGKQLQVAADQTALHVLEAAGIDVPMSCGQGIGGTCWTRVVGGNRSGGGGRSGGGFGGGGGGYGR